MRKQDIPLSVLKSIKKIKNDLKNAVIRESYVELENEELSTIKFVDKDDHSDFYFELSNSSLFKGTPVHIVMQKPISDNSVNVAQLKLAEDQVVIKFNNWLKIIKGYNSISLNHEQLILAKYQEEIYSDFELIDDNELDESFDWQTQQLLDDYLNQFILFLENKNDDSLDEILQETSVLQRSLTKLTKKEFVSELSRIFSKIRMIGVQLFKDIYNEGKRQIIKKLVSGGFEGIEQIQF